MIPSRLLPYFQVPKLIPDVKADFHIPRLQQSNSPVRIRLIKALRDFIFQQILNQYLHGNHSAHVSFTFEGSLRCISGSMVKKILTKKLFPYTPILNQT